MQYMSTYTHALANIKYFGFNATIWQPPVYCLFLIVYSTVEPILVFSLAGTASFFIFFVCDYFRLRKTNDFILSFNLSSGNALCHSQNDLSLYSIRSVKFHFLYFFHCSNYRTPQRIVYVIYYILCPFHIRGFLGNI